MASVTLPANYLPMVVLGASVYGSSFDDDDVQTVVGYEIDPRHLQD